MPIDVVTFGAIAGLIAPIYAALWSMNRRQGRIAKATEHNEGAIEDISTAVDRVETAVIRSDTVDVTGADS